MYSRLQALGSNQAVEIGCLLDKVSQRQKQLVARRVRFRRLVDSPQLVPRLPFPSLAFVRFSGL